VCEWRVACAEDHVWLALDAKLLLERRPYVDFAEDTEAFCFQLVTDALDRGGVSSCVVVLRV
jgi:hypothetical protein